MLSWVKTSRSCTVFFKKIVNFIILNFYFLSGQTWQYVPYYILPDSKKICFRLKKTRWGNPIVNLIIRGSSLRHILSRLTRQEMTIRRKKSDGLFLLVIPLFGRIKMLIMQSAVCTLWPNRSSLLFGKYLEILLIWDFIKTTEL